MDGTERNVGIDPGSAEVRSMCSNSVFLKGRTNNLSLFRQLPSLTMAIRLSMIREIDSVGSQCVERFHQQSIACHRLLPYDPVCLTTRNPMEGRTMR